MEDESLLTVRSINELLSLVEKLYVLHMKKFLVIDEMMDPDNRKKFENQRIQIKIADTKVDYYALFEKLDYPYFEYQHSVNSFLIFYRIIIINL